MRVTVAGKSPDNMTVTFYITSKEEKASFHDHAAISLCDGGHKFIGHVYSPETYGGNGDPVEYNIPVKEPIK